MPFTVEVAGQVFNTGDLTIDEAIAIEKETGETWRTMTPLHSAKHWRAIAKTFLLRSMGSDEVESVLSKVRADQAVEATEWVATDTPDAYEDGAPLVAGGASTST